MKTLKLLLPLALFAAGVPFAAGLSPEALKPEHHPLLLCRRDALEALRAQLPHRPELQAYRDAQLRAAGPLPEFGEAQLRALLPPPGSPVVYGLGMNLDPAGERLRWTSWHTPFKVRGADETVYPNDAYPDDGSGCEKDGKRYHFTARAYGFIYSELEERALPALADLYALSGDRRYARAAAILFDALAAVYPARRDGPLDYPVRRQDRGRTGRLQRAYYMTARGLENYALALDLLAHSGELERPSGNPAFATIREHVAANLLADGGRFCYDWAREGGQLTNGLADYVRGAAFAGVLLRDPELVAPLAAGPASLSTMLDNNIDRNGFYYEVSTTYAIHTNALYFSMAELLEAARTLGLTEAESAYRQPALPLFSSRFFIRRELSGHMPTLGDDGPDRFRNPPMQRRSDPARPTLSDRYLDSQCRNAWILALRGDPATGAASRRLLRALYGDAPVRPPADRWLLFNLTPELIAEVERTPLTPGELTEESNFFGAKGLALLRGGRLEKRYGAQLAAGHQTNHGQREALSWTFFSCGFDWSNDPGYFNSHYRHSWTTVTVAHQSMTVNGKCFEPLDGGGALDDFFADEVVQFVRGSHPGAYRREGVTHYERLIGQRPNPATGELGYWLDLGFVAGGEFRDDSFHTVMKRLTADAEFEPTGKYALFPGLSEKNTFRRDYRLTGFEKRDFRYEIPGHGYALLTRPRRLRTDGPIRLELADPAFVMRADFRGKIVVDLPGAPKREYLAATHPGLPVTKPVEYLIRRDAEPGGNSLFAKVIRVLGEGEADHLLGAEALPVDSTDPLAAAIRVRWRDGRTDLWLASREKTALNAETLPTIATDARIAFLAFNAAGELQSVRAAGGAFLKVGGRALRPEHPEARAKIVELRSRGFRLDRALPADRLPAGTLVRTIPATGISAAWSFKKLTGRELEVADQGILLARAVPVIVDPADRRRFRAAFPVSRFSAPAARYSEAAALGKTVLAGGKDLGRITALAADGVSFTLDRPLPPKVETVDLAEAGPGDELVIPALFRYDKPASSSIK